MLNKRIVAVFLCLLFLLSNLTLIFFGPTVVNADVEQAREEQGEDLSATVDDSEQTPETPDMNEPGDSSGQVPQTPADEEKPIVEPENPQDNINSENDSELDPADDGSETAGEGDNGGIRPDDETNPLPGNDFPSAHEERLDENLVQITFDTQCSLVIEAKSLQAGDVLGELPLPERDGYIFQGWYFEDGTIASPDTMVNNSIILYAAWEMIPENPDHLLAPDDSPYAGEIRYDIFPETPFTAFLSPQRMMYRSVKANNPPVIGQDHPENPGDVMLFKEAKPVQGKINTWEITLRVEGKNKPVTSDIVLVIDTSGSMEDNGRMESAIKAANAFIDELLPSKSTRIGIVSFASKAKVEQSLTNDKSSLTKAVNGLSAGGGTFTQAGVKQAEELLENSQAQYKHIVLLSDGEPTYSYALKNPDAYLVHSPSEDLWETNTTAPASDYLSDRVGNGRSLRTFYDSDSHYGEKYYNHGNSAIAEAGFAKAANQRVWTIALDVGTTGQIILYQMASSNSYFTADPNSLQGVFAEIAGQIGLAVNDASVTDPMGTGFQIPATDVNHISTTQGEATYANNNLSWNPGTLTTPISEGSDIAYAEMKYTVEINDDILNQEADENGEYPTNGDATISYTDADGADQTASFPVPKVNPVFYKLVKVLQDKDGNETTADRDFTVVLTGPGTDGPQTKRNYVLNTNTQGSTKLLTDLRYASTYTFEETGDLTDYDVSYFVNGVESQDKQFTIKDGNTEDVTVKVVNKEKAGTLTITKVLDQTAITTKAKRLLTTRGPVSFSFTVTGPNNYSETFALPEAGSWTKTLEGLAKGTYTVTENDADGYTTSFKVDDGNSQEGKTATVEIGIGNGKKRERSVTFTNKQTENLTITATKKWEKAPSEKPEIWFQLLRVDADGSETKIGTPKKVPSAGDTNTVTWNQGDPDLAAFANDFVRYDAKGKPYTYKVREVNTNGEDFVPENYTKQENDLTVTNTHNPIKVRVTKSWADNNNQDGKRPESVTIKLLADGKETDKTLMLTAVNKWAGTFTDLDEYKAGKKIIYTVKEETIGNGYTAVVTGNAEAGFIVTNSRTPETITVIGSKTWEDNNNQDGKRPESITIRLLKNGTEIDKKTVTEADGWAWSFKDLAKYEKGKQINYTINEDKVEGYSTEVAGYNVTNTHTLGKTSVRVTKSWADGNNQDGKRPESVTIKLLADGKETDKTLMLTAVNKWAGTFTDLDEYKAGKKIIYTVKEETIGNGYTAVVTGNAETGFIVTNSRTPETITVSGSKTWEDNDNQDGKRPESITIRLLQNGTEIATKAVTEADGWSWSFENLPKYEAGTLITYTITEDAVAEYSTKVSGHNVTNTHTPDKTSVQVTKAWADGNNQDGVRPESVTIKLLADGKDAGKTLTLTESNNWTDTFKELDEYKAGQKIVYTIEELNLGNGYTSSITGDAKTGFIVTNVRTPSVPTIQIPCPPQCETGYVPCSTLPQKVHALPRTGETESGMWPLMLMMAGFILLILRKQRF